MYLAFVFLVDLVVFFNGFDPMGFITGFPPPFGRIWFGSFSYLFQASNMPLLREYSIHEAFEIADVTLISIHFPQKVVVLVKESSKMNA